MIDVRHEQAAAFTCQAYSRLQQKPTSAWRHRARRHQPDHRHRQRADRLLPGGGDRRLEPDQPVRPPGVPGDRPGRADARLLQACRPACYNLKRIPQQVNFALQKAMTGKPGPVYVDCPGDILYQRSTRTRSTGASPAGRSWTARPLGDPRQVDALVKALAEAEAAADRVGLRRDLVARLGRDAGSSSRRPASRSTPRRKAAAWCRTIIRARYLSMRSSAFRDADLIIVLGTRMNYIIGHASPPRFGRSAKIARIDIDPAEIADRRALRRYPDRRRLQGGAAAAARRHQGQGQRRTATRRGARSWPTARRRSAARPAPTSTPRTATSIRCACSRRCETSPSATRSCASMGRRR